MIITLLVVDVLNLYMLKVDDDNCGACVYERCRCLCWWICEGVCFWWWLFDEWLVIKMFMFGCWLWWWWIMLLNYYMQMMVILLVNAWRWNDGELLLNMCIVCHMFMHHKSWDIYIQLRWSNTLYSKWRWLWCSVGILRWRPCWWLVPPFTCDFGKWGYF